MEELAKKLLKELEKEKETEFIKIAKKRAREIIQLIDEPNRIKRFNEHRERCKLAAIKKMNKMLESGVDLVVKRRLTNKISHLEKEGK